MSLTALLNRTCTITRRSPSGDVDDYGNRIDADVAADVLCELQQQRRDEPAAAGEVSDTRWLLVLPADTAIDGGDLVTVDGRAFEVVGEPWPARNPRTLETSHVEATLRRTAGADEAS